MVSFGFYQAADGCKHSPILTRSISLAALSPLAVKPEYSQEELGEGKGWISVVEVLQTC